MTIKEFLQQAYIAHNEVELKLEQIERLRSLSVRTTAKFSNVPVKASCPGSRIENAIALIDEQADRLADEVVSLLEINKTVADAIAKVKNSAERTVLEYRYLCFFSWPQIATVMKTGLSNVYRIHSAALKNFSSCVVNCSKL